MKEPKTRVLVVDDYAPWCHFVTSTLGEHPGFVIVGEASDGLAAVSKAQELQPDLVLLDIGLPKLNGIEAARQIRELASSSKILFITENQSWVIAEEALRTGARGYFVKSDAARDLLPAIRAVLQGKQFVSSRFAGRQISNAADGHDGNSTHKATVTPSHNQILRRHDVCLYSDHRSLIDNLTQFIGAALNAGSGAIVVANEAHRNQLVRSLEAKGINMQATTNQGRYVAVDAAETVAAYMDNGLPDRARFLKAFGDLIHTVAQAARQKHHRIAVFGEGVDILWAQGNREAAIQVEKWGNDLIKSYDLDILCAYSLGGVQGGIESPAFQPICAEHSAAHSF